MKERISITVDKELLEWVDRRIAEKIFSNRSHALEFLMSKRMQIEQSPIMTEDNHSQR